MKHRKDAGKHTWYWGVECVKCADKTLADGDVIAPSTMSLTSKKHKKYELEYLRNVSDNHWIYWKGYWGNQRWENPVEWAYNPNPSGYVICTSAKGKVIGKDLGGNILIFLIVACLLKVVAIVRVSGFYIQKKTWYSMSTLGNKKSDGGAL